MAVPVHIWHGTRDRNVPVAYAYVIAATCPAARLHIVDGGGHMLLSHLERIMNSITLRRR
jgi:pimeloyl-ACP methyl ester carboxylesterase